MAVTGFWPIYKNLKATLDYADNPDKTTDRRYLDDDLYAALSYAENDNKTDRKMYVGGINCSKQNAYAEMVAVRDGSGFVAKWSAITEYKVSVKARSHRSRRLKSAKQPPERCGAIGIRCL